MSDFQLCYTKAQAEEIAGFEKLAAENYNALAQECDDIKAVCNELMEAIDRVSMFISVREIGGQKAYELAVAAYEKARRLLTTNSPEVENG